MLFDTHCHVHFHAYKQDMDEVIRRTLEKGIFLLTVGTQKDTSRYGLEVAERYDGMWASVGLHPNHLVKQEFWDDQEFSGDEHNHIKTRAEEFDASYYRELSRHPKCLAIGECGLDYYRIPEDVSHTEIFVKQEAVVRAHFDLATEVKLPILIHCRDAHQLQADLIVEYVSSGKLGRRGIIHCFTGTKEEAERYIGLGFYISFGGILTFPPRKAEDSQDGLSDVQRVAKELPIEWILLETDAPYLTPLPFRGQRNEPWYVQFVAEKLAELKGMTVEEVADVTTQNAKKLFGI